jgi:hypothetical protein
MFSEWIPFFQSLVWPLFLAVFLILARRQVVLILKSIQRRIEEGAYLHVGTTGFSLGESNPKMTRLGQDQDLKPAGSPDELREFIYLVHDVTGPRQDLDGTVRRGIRLVLEADSDEILNQVERVIYHLHPTFPNPDIEIKDRISRFELRTRAWGEFNVSADVFVKGYSKSVTLYRYLNF